MTRRSPNWADKTIFTGDNLPIMRGMNSESVDLIYLDPPFNSKTDYAAPIGSKAAGAAFKDTWSLSDIDVEWINLMEDRHPALWRVLLAAMTSSNKSYLAYMAVRLLEMRRLLKDTGSIYLHCDPTMSYYLNLVMDAIFGAGRFRNEIVWKRTAGRSDARRFGRVHDTILYYAGGELPTWNAQYLPHDPAYVKRAYRNTDKRGRWRSDQLTASGLRAGESGAPWRGIDPGRAGNHWRTPTKGGMNDWIISQGQIPGWPDRYPGVHERLDALDAAGLIHWPERGSMPALKRYLASAKGTAVEDILIDVKKLEGSAREKVGYPTQKPLALLERLIAASSNPGDLVLDPFCGCATACVAAEKLNRGWAGIDISARAADLVHERLASQPPLGIGALFHNRLVTHRIDIPMRNDLVPLPAYNCAANRATLYGQQEGNCAGCGEHFKAQHLTVDHIISRKKGGTDHIENLQLLCGHCNSVKGDRGMEYLRTKLQLVA